jgi:hypothetical protein
MNTKLISDKSLAVINQYKNFQVGNAICSVPYFNNKTRGIKGGLRVEVGKGSPKEIFEEVKTLLIQEKVADTEINSEQLKQLLVNHNIGIDCSGFAYYVLNEESKSRGKGGLDKHIHFIRAKNILAKFIVKFKPETNIDVLTFADNKNSRLISLEQIECGDMITMTSSTNNGERNHILIISQIEYQNFKPITLHYVHAVAWPTDGEYGHGIHEGKIDITDLNKKITEQIWVENDKTGAENYTFTRAQNSQTELRRLAFL